MDLRWGLIGGSDIAATRMIPAMRILGQQISAVAGSSPARARAFATAHGIPVATGDAETVVERDDVDAVYVSSPNALHAPHTLAAVAAGKHVLCEKPLALDLESARSMVRAAADAGVQLAVNHHLPGHTSHAAVRRLVADGAAGKVMAVRVFFAFELAERLRGWRLTDSAVGGPILDLMPHVAAVLGTIAGTPVEAVAMTASQGAWTAAVEDAAVIGVRYQDGVLAQAHLGWTTPFARNALEVHGTAGSVVATDVMRADPGGRVEVRDAAGTREIDLGEQQDAYQVTLRAFAEAVAGRGRPLIDGRAGLSALAVTLAVRESARTGETVTVAAGVD